METVRITHPDLPGREVDVPASAADHWARAGWRRADQPSDEDSVHADQAGAVHGSVTVAANTTGRAEPLIAAPPADTPEPAGPPAAKPPVLGRRRTSRSS